MNVYPYASQRVGACSEVPRLRSGWQRCCQLDPHDSVALAWGWRYRVRMTCTILYNHEVQNPLMCGFHHEVISSCRDFICQSRQISFFVPTKSGWDPYDSVALRSGWRTRIRSLEQLFQDDSRAVNSPSTTLQNDNHTIQITQSKTRWYADFITKWFHPVRISSAHQGRFHSLLH